MNEMNFPLLEVVPQGNLVLFSSWEVVPFSLKEHG